MFLVMGKIQFLMFFVDYFVSGDKELKSRLQQAENQIENLKHQMADKTERLEDMVYNLTSQLTILNNGLQISHISIL